MMLNLERMVSMLSSKRFIMYTLIVISIIVFSSVNIIAENTSNLNKFEKVSENELLKLYINNDTTEIAVENKLSKKVWFSNPQNIDSMEKMARGRNKDALKSQLAIEFYNASDRLFLMDSYNDSILNGQYEISKIDDGIRIDYELGKKWDEDDYMPSIVSQEVFENEIMAKLSKSDSEFLQDQYHLISISELEEGQEHLAIFGVDTDKLFAGYDIKVLSENMSDKDRRILIQNYLKEIVDAKGYSGLGSVKHEDIKPLIAKSAYVLRSDILPWDTEAIINAFKKAGFTPVKIQEEHNNFNFTPPWANIENFKLAIEYILDEGDLVVRVPSDSIEYPQNVIDQTTGNRVTLPLTSVSILPYFEAADINQEGFMLVPDGSGALIHLNNKKTDIPPYKKQVYGRDFSVEAVEELAPYLEQKIHMPVYGLSQGDKGFMAIIEKGDSLAKINSEVAGMRDSYNKIYSSYEIIPKTQVTLGGDLDHLYINMYQSRNYNRDIVIRYKLLGKDQTSYSSMANLYQDYLVKKYSLKKLDSGSDIPFYLEIMGGINKTVPVMGIPRRRVMPLTTYQQAITMINQISEYNIDNLAVLYSGWSKGGIKHNFPNSISLEGNLGTRTDFSALKKLTEEKGIDFFPELSFLNVYKNTLLDGFNVLQDNAKFLNRKYAFIYDQFWIDTYQSDDDEQKFILKPSSLDGLTNDFLKDYQEYDINGLSLRYMGNQINSDFNADPDKLIDREQAKDIIINQLEKITKEKGHKLSLRGGNMYTLPYTSYIIDAPIYSGSDTIFDQGIPFYQMVLHGYINYSGRAINLAQKPVVHLLKLIEVGGVPYYRWSFEDASVVKQSEFDDQYSIYYKDFIEDAVSFYREANMILGGLQGQRIIVHERVAANVYRVVYENETSIIINYNQEAVQVNDLLINGLDYKVIKEEI